MSTQWIYVLMYSAFLPGVIVICCYVNQLTNKTDRFIIKIVNGISHL